MRKTILFDLDGTITDSSEGIINSVLYAINKLKLSYSGDLNRFIGPPLHKSFEQFCQLPPDKAFEAVETFREYFREKGINENRLYPQVEDILNILKDRYKLIIATSKPLHFAKIVLNNFKLTSYFTDIYGSNLDGSFTDKSEIIGKIIDDFNLNRDETLMVGDRSHDGVGANNNGIDFVWAKYGYGSVEELKACSIYKSLERFDQIIDIK